MEKTLTLGPFVEILRGKTAFPHRPITGDRFLIGAGGNCHLQLGGPDVPMLHSVIVLAEGQAQIEAFAAAPALLVNDRPCREADLRTGDVVRIGKIEFTLHQLDAPASPSLISEIGLPFTAEISESLSVAELVDRIELEQAEVQTWDAGRTHGANALLDAVRRAGQQALSPSNIGQPVEQLDRTTELLGELRQLSQDLADRERLLCERERACEERGRQLAQAQEQLAHQLSMVLTALDRQSGIQTPKRASA